jgi:hypothetical protein
MSKNDDRVGHGKPPKHSQFKPGQSGNPQGRKPLFGNFASDLFEELNAETSIRENGVERKVSKQRAIINALVEAAISGNMRVASTLLAIFVRSLPAQPEQDQEPASEAADQDLLKRFERRQRVAGTGQQTSSKKPGGDQHES